METRFYRRFRLWRLPFLISKKIKIRERRETRLLRYTDSEWQGCLNIWTVFCLNCGGTTKNRSGDLGFNNIYGIFTAAIDTLKVLVIALGAGLGVWGVINLLEGYGNDNPGAKSQGMKQLMAGGGVALIGMQLIPLLANLFN